MCRCRVSQPLAADARRRNGFSEPHSLNAPLPPTDWMAGRWKDKLIKIGAKVVSHGRYVIFQMAEVAIARQIFQEILRLIAELRTQPPPAPA